VCRLLDMRGIDLRRLGLLRERGARRATEQVVGGVEVSLAGSVAGGEREYGQAAGCRQFDAVRRNDIGVRSRARARRSRTRSVPSLTSWRRATSPPQVHTLEAVLNNLSIHTQTLLYPLMGSNG
jgi:hypothetical protein